MSPIASACFNFNPNPYPNLYAMLESNSSARRLYAAAPAQVRTQLRSCAGRIRSLAALDAAIRTYSAAL